MTTLGPITVETPGRRLGDSMVTPSETRTARKVCSKRRAGCHPDSRQDATGKHKAFDKGQDATWASDRGAALAALL